MARRLLKNELHDFLGTLNGVSSVDEAWASTVDFMRALGATHLNLGMDPQGPRAWRKWTSPNWVRDMYMEEVYPDHDPKLAHCRDSMTPFQFGKEFWYLHPDMPVKRRYFDEEIVNAGTRSVVSYPIHEPASGSWGYVSIHTDYRADVFEDFLKRYSATLHLAGTMAYNRLRSLLGEERASEAGLTTTERECLLWLSCGLRESEIADQIGLRPASVNRHLASATWKLNAQTRDQALVNAIQLGLLEV